MIYTINPFHNYNGHSCMHMNKRYYRGNNLAGTLAYFVVTHTHTCTFSLFFLYSLILTTTTLTMPFVWSKYVCAYKNNIFIYIYVYLFDTII